MNQKELNQYKIFLEEVIAQEESRRISHSLTGLYRGSPNLSSIVFNTTEIIVKANSVLQRFASEYGLRYDPIIR